MREFSIINKMYIYMVFNSIMMPGLKYTIFLRIVQLLAFPRLSAPNPLEIDTTVSCDKLGSTFDIFYSIDFFLVFMVQTILFTIVFQVFVILPDRVFRKHSGAAEPVRHKKRTQAYSNNVSFINWYFSFDYQVSFSTSILTIVLIFSSSVPLITPLGLIFFIMKYVMDVNQRVILR